MSRTIYVVLYISEDSNCSYVDSAFTTLEEAEKYIIGMDRNHQIQESLLIGDDL